MITKEQQLGYQALEKIIQNSLIMNIMGEVVRKRVASAGSALEVGKTILTEEEIKALGNLTAEDLDKFRIRKEWIELSSPQKTGLQGETL